MSESEFSSIWSTYVSARKQARTHARRTPHARAHDARHTLARRTPHAARNHA